MKHWLQLVDIPNTSSSSSGPELQSLKKRIADLEKARSRSPRRNAQKQAALSGGPSMLALPAPSGPAQGKTNRGNRGKGRLGRNNCSKPGSSAGPARAGLKDFDYLFETPARVSQQLHRQVPQE